MDLDYMGDLNDMMSLIGLLRQHPSIFDDNDTSSLTWMKKSADSPPSSALNPPDVLGFNSQNGQQNDVQPQFSNNVSESNAPFRFRRQQKQEIYPQQCMNQVYPTPSYDNSNIPWDPWPPVIKNEHNSSQYNLPSRPTCSPSGSDWSARESSANNSQQVASYGMMQQPQSNSIGHAGSSYYNNNGYQNNMYNNNYSQVGYSQPNYVQHQQTYQHPQPPRMVNRFSQHTSVPMARQPVPDFQRQHNQNVVQGPPNVELPPREQTKKEPERCSETQAQNFSSVFTTSFFTLMEPVTENEFGPGNNQDDIPTLTELSPFVSPARNSPASFQRLHTSGGHFTTGMSGEYPGERNNFGFFENRMQNSIPPENDVQEMEPSKDFKMNSFRYDRPSFDDFSLYASNTTISKPPTNNKRKNNFLNLSHENHATDTRKKTPLATAYKSESWTPPTSFESGTVSIKQEPVDDYSSSEFDSQLSYKESSPGSSGNGIRVKTPEQQKDHPAKQPVRKRSPGSTCFDRFDKKSTPTTKKVSPLSVYAKVQESIVLSVKCRRYKKRTKPITIKEEPVSPDREEMENYKRLSLTPDQAARCVMSDLVERVSLYGERNVVGDLSQMDPRQLRDRLLQFCQRSNLDYRDFEEPSCILRPRIVMDTKNSVRASAIRKRTSTSPVEVQQPLPQEQVVKTRRRGRKKADLKESPPVEKRVLRQLPGRSRGRPRSQTPVDTNRDSTQKSKEGEEVKKVAEVIDLGNDSEDEASKVAEVQKKSQRGKRKRVSAVKATNVCGGSLEENDLSNVSINKNTKKKKDVVDKASVPKKSTDRVKPVCRRRKREVSLEDVTNLVENEAHETVDDLRRRTRSRGRRVVIPEEIPKPPPRKRRSCTQRKTNYNFESEVEIVDIIPRSLSQSPPVSNKRRQSHSPPVLHRGKPYSRSPPMLNVVKIEPPSLKPANRTKPKRTRKRRKTKNVKKDSSRKCVKTKTVDVKIEIEPPVLHNSVSETETRDALKMEPPLLEFAEPIKKRKSNKAKLTSFEALVMKTKDEIKIEPFDTAQDVQKTGKENASSVYETTFVTQPRKDNKNPILSSNNKFLKNTIEPTFANSVVKSGSSKRKQEGPIKYLKENSKKATSHTFLKLNSSNQNLVPDVMNDLDCCTPNLVPNSNSSNFTKVDTQSAIVPASNNSAESLKERYQKSFCVDSLSLPNTSWRRSKETVEKSLKTSSLKKSNDSTKTLKESLETSSHYLNPSMMQENEDFTSKLKINNSDKTFYNLLKNIKAPCDTSSGFVAKVKEEPLSDDDIPFNYSYVTTSEKSSKANNGIKTEKKFAKSATTSKAKSDIKTVKMLPLLTSAPISKDNDNTKPVKKPTKHASNANGYIKTEKKPSLHSLSIRNVPRRRSSKSSESELQVVLTVLPDAQVDLQNGSVTKELVKKCEKEQERVEAVIKEEEELSEYDSDEDKPLAYFQTKKTPSSGKYNDLQSEFSLLDEKGSPGTWKDDNLNTPRSLNHRRCSDSDDSDCGLVIDLDRRPSVEEQVSSPTPTNKEEEKADQDAPSKETLSDSITIKQSSPSSTDVKEESIPSDSRDTFYHDATEEAHILLELSRSGMRSLNEDTAEPSTSSWIPSTVNASEAASDDGPGEKGSVERGSILRTLLLENGDAAVGQDPVSNPGPSTSKEHQNTLSQEVERDIMHQAHLSPFLAAGNSPFDPTQFSPDQLPPGLDLDFENREWTCWDVEEIQAEIAKVRIQIKGLSKMADGKDRERTSIMCYMKYKEEVLKQLLKRYSAKLKKPEMDLEKEKSPKESEDNTSVVASPSTATVGEHSQESSQLSFHSTVKTVRPSSTMTSNDSLAGTSGGENLPPVASMVAKATENYGVDLRTVTCRQEDVHATPTILQEAPSSSDPVYRPIATRSSNETSPIVRKKFLATQECAFIPNLPSNPDLPKRSHKSSSHYSRRRFRRSPPSLTPEFTPSTHSHIRTSEMVLPHYDSSTPSHHNGPMPDGASTSSPKGGSSTTNRDRSVSRTEPGSPLNLNSIDLSTHHMFSNRFPSNRQFNDHRSTTIKANDLTSNRSATIMPIGDHSSSRSSPLELFSDHPSSRSASVRLNNGDSSSSSSSMEQVNGHNRSNPINGRTYNRSASNRLANGYSSNRLGSIELYNGHSSNRSPIELTNDQTSFMIVPPPTTLQSSFGSSDLRASTSKARSERKLEIKVEDNPELVDEGPQSYYSHASSTSFTPYAGPLMAISTTLDHQPRCKGCGNDRPNFVCSGCKSHWYCSTECQSLQWAEHSRTCLQDHLKENSKSYN